VAPCSIPLKGIIVTRNGKPSAVIVGLESYDDEGLQLASSPQFWRMIQQRRGSGASISLSELKTRLKLDEYFMVNCGFGLSHLQYLHATVLLVRSFTLAQSTRCSGNCRGFC
jgi:hypothetical protein